LLQEIHLVAAGYTTADEVKIPIVETADEDKSWLYAEIIVLY